MERQQIKVYTKSSLHSISPYIGKLRPETANLLVTEFSREEDIIYDPFCGSGTVALEAWINKREAIGVDLNFYAFILTKAKLNPYLNVEYAKEKFYRYQTLIKEKKIRTDMRKIPIWVKQFFHPKTLREISLWTSILLNNEEWFLLACLMGILHHQRPGFLSYPSSHGAPYLRINKFPKNEYPELYEYRSVDDRLLAKIERSYKNIPSLDFSLKRNVFNYDTINFSKKSNKQIIIITSPPYMKSLTYARDNRLRLWFLGYPNWQELDKKISMPKNDFISLMDNCFQKWRSIQQIGTYCILIIGDIDFEEKGKMRLPNAVCEVAKKHGYTMIEIRDYPINTDRKFEKRNTKIKNEKICVLRR
jgi:16S rRNA G966 N2-methylase RsmD